MRRIWLFFEPLADWRSTQATAAERAFLRGLEAGCSLPVAAYARIDGDRLLLQGRVIALDGRWQVDVAGETRAQKDPAGGGPRGRTWRRAGGDGAGQGSAKDIGIHG